jgi:hypothetical protein
LISREGKGISGTGDSFSDSCHLWCSCALGVSIYQGLQWARPRLSLGCRGQAVGRSDSECSPGRQVRIVGMMVLRLLGPSYDGLKSPTVRQCVEVCVSWSSTTITKTKMIILERRKVSEASVRVQ